MLKTGYVEKIFEKNHNGKTFYSVVVDNTFYGTGVAKPKCRQGDFIQMEVEQKGQYWNADPSSISPATKPEEKKSAEPAQKAGAAKASTWVPDKDRQDAISFQAARKDAIETVKLLADAGAVDFGKAKVGDKADIVQVWISQLTEQYFRDTKALKPSGPNGTKETTSEAPAADGEPFDDKLPW